MLVQSIGKYYLKLAFSREAILSTLTNIDVKVILPLDLYSDRLLAFIVMNEILINNSAILSFLISLIVFANLRRNEGGSK